MQVFLIRHGETDSNASRVVQLPDAPLSARGREQARRLGARLAAAGVVRVVASDLARARSTAEAVCEATGAPLVLDPLLHERSFGAVRGTPYAELEHDIFGPDYAPPEGETWQVFHARVDRAWEAVRRHAADLTGNLAVVTHGLVLRSLTERLLDVPRDLVRPSAWLNTCVTTLAGPPTFRVSELACTRHLDGMEAAVRRPGPA